MMSKDEEIMAKLRGCALVVHRLRNRVAKTHEELISYSDALKRAEDEYQQAMTQLREYLGSEL